MADAEYHRRWHHKNKHRTGPARRQRNRDDYKEKKSFITAKKVEAGKCSVCGFVCTNENHVSFDWDHIDPQTKSFALGETKGHSWRKIEDELAKCRLVCKNCHAKISFEDQTWKIRRGSSPQLDDQLTLFDDEVAA